MHVGPAGVLQIRQSVSYFSDWQHESRAVAKKPRDAAAVLFGLKFAGNIHYNYKFKSSQVSKAMLQSSKWE